MIRTNARMPFLGRWVQPADARDLVSPAQLTTARVEPLLRSHLGFTQIDFVFERDGRCCVIVGSVVDGNMLLTRERSAIEWRADVAGFVDHGVLDQIAELVTPWLRSIARARPLSEELVRRYASSASFERARALRLPGAAPLEQSLCETAPFVYARRFAAGASVDIRCKPAALAWAMLVDVAGHITCGPPRSDDDAFTRSWFGLPDAAPGQDAWPEVALHDYVGPGEQKILVTAGDAGMARTTIVEVASPTPWDVINVFDPADAPSVAQFAVRAANLPLRTPLVVTSSDASGVSGSGTIALAIAPDAHAVGGEESCDIRALGRRLTTAGFGVVVSTNPGEIGSTAIDLVHIVGSIDDPHIEPWAVAARRAGVPYVLDIAPVAGEESNYFEKMLYKITRTTTDDATTERYYEMLVDKRVTAPLDGERSPDAVAAAKAGFVRAAADAASLLVACESTILRGLLSPTILGRLQQRGTLRTPTANIAPIGHLVPHGRFALVHGPFGWPAHALLAAMAMERAAIPCVIAGNVYDVDYLASLRMAAPSAVILADPEPGVVEALYRRAAWWVDAAPRPRSAGGLLRAVACGALPVVADRSPLRALVGESAPCFPPNDIAAAAESLRAAWSQVANPALIATLQTDLAPLIDPEQSFGRILAAYAPASAEAAHR